MSAPSTRPEPHKTRLQFTVVHAFAAMAACGLFFALVIWSGWWGALFFGCLSSLAIIGLGMVKRDKYYIVAGMVVFWIVACLFDQAPGKASYHFSTYSFPVHVVNSAGMPVDQANIRMREVLMIDLPTDIPIESISRETAHTVIESGMTDARGTTGVRYALKTVWSSGWWGRSFDYVIIPRHLWIQVDAPGYKRTSFRVSDVTGDHHHLDAPLPPLEVTLDAEDP